MAGNCVDCGTDDYGNQCEPHTYPLAPPVHQRVSCDDKHMILEANIYDPFAPPYPRVPTASELGDGSASESACASTRYFAGSLVQHHMHTFTDATGETYRCKVIRKAGPLAEGDGPLELMSGPLGPNPQLKLSAHNWHDFVKACQGPHCNPGPLNKICDTCVCFIMSFANQFSDGTDWNEIYFDSGEHCGMYAGIYVDTTCFPQDSDCDNCNYYGACHVIDPTTLSDVYDPAVHHVKIQGAYRDGMNYDRPHCNGVDKNVRVTVQFMPGVFA